MKNYELISGQLIDLTAEAPDAIEFLDRLHAMAAAPGATHAQMITLAYGLENPILDKHAIPGRGAVTAQVIGTAPYRVMTDILFRKEIGERGVTMKDVADQFTMTPAEAAEQLGVSVSAIRQAIDAERLGSWVKSGRVFLDPRAVSAFKLTPRGPKPSQSRAPVCPLEFRAGTRDGKTLHVRFAGQKQAELVPAGGAEAGGKIKSAEGKISHWRRVGVLTGAAGRARFTVLVPSTQEETIAFGHFFVRGQFSVAEKINGTKAAKDAWKAFSPA